MEFECIKELEENSYEVYIEVSSILLRLIDNVIRNPSNPKYRRLRIGNATVSEKLLPAIGAMECLFTIGFKEDGDGLLLPNDVSIKSLQSFRDKINLQKTLLDKKKSFTDEDNSSNSDRPKVSSSKAESHKHNEINQDKTSHLTKPGQSLLGTNTLEVSPSEPESRKCNEMSQKETQNLIKPNQSPPEANSSKVFSSEPESLKRNEVSQNQTQVSTEPSTSIAQTLMSRPSERRPNQTIHPDPQESGANQRYEPSAEGSSEENNLLQKIEIQFSKMTRYEDEKLQAKALEVMPKAELYNKVAQQLKRLDQSDNTGGDDLDGKLHAQELILAELLKWFKRSFFTWVDKPECTSCQGPTVEVGELPSNDEAISRIETYKCTKCGSEVLFPRYGDPEILLQSRKGRCGEWANCFMLFCRALKWDTRFVYDVTDHVWTEVYSIRQKRWLHCDPCETALDTPLMYEKGWGKNLSYVIAFSIEEVQDVTWRYTIQHQEICKRRKAVPEEELINKILSLSKKRQPLFSAERNQFILRRRIAELVEFLTPPQSAEEYGGRTSGSKEWREARGEFNSKTLQPHHIWKPSSEAIKNSKFQIEYSTSLDKYVDRSTGAELSGWENGVYSAESIFRKEELDWKQTYLARIEGSAVGKIEWKFNFESCGMAVNQIRVRCPHTVYENATVRWSLCDEEKCVNVSEGEEFVSEAAPGTSEITLSAELENGKGNLAWQHAQLFRQSTTASDFIFCVTVTFKPKQENDLSQLIPAS